MMKRLGYWMMVAALVTAGCSGEGTIPAEEERCAIRLTGSIATGSSRAVTSLQSQQLKPQNSVGVAISGANIDADNSEWIVSDNGELMPQSNHFLYNGNPVTIKAYAPFQEGYSFSDGTQLFSVQADQSSDDGYVASDLLWADPVTVNTAQSAAVPLTFHHLLAKITVNLWSSSVSPLASTITLTGTTLDAHFAPKDGIATKHDNTTNTITVGTTTTSASAIVVPQMVDGARIDVENQGKCFSYGLPEQFSFVANTEYTFNLELHETEITLKSIGISPWSDPENHDAQASMSQYKDGVAFVACPGDLATLLDETARASLTSLTVSGYLNGTDYKVLREMALNNSLTSIDLSDTYVAEGGEAYYTSGSTEYYTILNELPASIFQNCENLTKIVLPTSITSIGSDAMAFCELLTNVEIPIGVTTIGSWAFWGCYAFTEINIPAGVTTIEASAFLACHNLQKVVLAEGLTSIKHDAFRDCIALTSIQIPESVSYIGNNAFEHCTALENANIPISLTDIPNWVFARCEKLQRADIPSEITTIGEYAYDCCKSLTNVQLPDGVTTIGYYAFANCTGLESINIPDGITIIDVSTFYGCSNLTSITLPDGLTEIRSYAFSGCSALSSISIPANVTTIGQNAFAYCANLSRIDCHIQDLGAEGMSVDVTAFKNVPTVYELHVPAGCADNYQMDPWSQFTIIGDL